LHFVYIIYSRYTTTYLQYTFVTISPPCCQYFATFGDPFASLEDHQGTVVFILLRAVSSLANMSLLVIGRSIHRLDMRMRPMFLCMYRDSFFQIGEL
jgi:hypothetical protein